MPIFWLFLGISGGGDPVATLVATLSQTGGGVRMAITLGFHLRYQGTSQQFQILRITSGLPQNLVPISGYFSVFPVVATPWQPSLKQAVESVWRF